MADNDAINLESLSDEEFLKLDPSQLQAVVSPAEDSSNASDPNVIPVSGDVSSDTPSGSEGGEQPGQAPAPVDLGSGGEMAPLEGSGGVQKPEVKDTPASGQPTANPAVKPEVKPEPGKPAAAAPAAETDKSAKEEKPKIGEDPVAVQAAALDFFKKVTAPFKADGKDIQVRSPEDAVRLMQMGVNYGRRMHEMKPMRAQADMLKSVGLDDPIKLNHMIDVMKGKPEAIQKLLKEVKIDPIDIDVTKPTDYKPTNHAVDPKTSAFREAIEATLAQDGGSELIRDINTTWDDQSKEALKDQPVIFQNLLDQRRSGIYEKVKTELNYQRTLGYLVGVPFVQAYHQVATAMQKAGVFNQVAPTKQNEVQSQQPLDTGTRKAVTQNSGTPAPNLSSTQQPRAVPSPTGGQPKPEQDYWAMSDEEFLKLKPPS
jgi:hypothetical protein